MNATYGVSTLKRGPLLNKKPVKGFISLIIAFVIGVTAFSSSFVKQETASAYDPTQWFMCLFGEGSIPQGIYQAAQNPGVQYNLLSKSAVTSGISEVDAGLNMMLSLTGANFKEVNEKILGRPLDPDSEEPIEDIKFNKGSAVSPYDRFGFAGLKFTSYSGEWKYVYVDACNPSDVQDPKSNLYYDTRLEPRSTWEDIPKSQDVRTIQFSKGSNAAINSAFVNEFSNFIFNITKFVLVLTISLVNLSFANIPELLGITEMVAGENGAGGIINALFTNIYRPIIFFAIILTALQVFIKVGRYQRYREGFVEITRSIGMFVVSIVVALNPVFFVSLPNNIVTTGQALILETMNTGVTGGKGLCSTNVGQFKSDIYKAKNGKEEQALKKASENMSSAIGCSLWQSFAVRPWVEGQYGTTIDNLWGNGQKPAKTKGKELGNENEEWVGEPIVPLGGGKEYNNWAIFQISTQTNAHAQYGTENELTKYSSGVANDWWRIVDALSNYDETEKTMSAAGLGGKQFKDAKAEITVPKDNETLDYWDQWVGNSEGSRIWAAISSLPIALLGVLSLLVFSFLSTVTAVGIEIIMAFAPIMFLFASWGGQGWEMFKGWANLLTDLILKRIIFAALLMLSITLTMAALKLMEDVGWWSGVIALIFASTALIKNKDRILQLLSGFRFSSVDFSGNVQRIGQTIGRSASTTARTGAVATAAGVSTVRHGGGFKKGFNSGIKNELRNKMYQTQGTRSALASYEAFKDLNNDDYSAAEVCASCGVKLDRGTSQIFFRDVEGNYYCFFCGDQMNDPDFREVILEKKGDPKKVVKPLAKKETVVFGDQNEINKILDHNASTETRIEGVQGMMEDLQKEIEKDYDESRTGEESIIDIPKELYPIFEEVGMISEIKNAWSEGHYDFVREAYLMGIITWVAKKTGEDLSSYYPVLRVE